MIRRRPAIVAILSLVMLAVPPAAGAALRPEAPRIGLLREAAPVPAELEAFREGLRALGYVEGENVVIEERAARGARNRLRGLAASLVRLRVAVIVVDGTAAARAARAATRTIPIVFTRAADPVGSRLVASLARPGGNLTGMSPVSSAAIAGRAQLLRDAMPEVTRVAVLHNPSDASRQLRETEAAAQLLAMRLQPLAARRPSEWPRAFAAMEGGRAQALLVLADESFSSQREQLVRLAVRARLPAVFAEREFVEAGALLSYGPAAADAFRRAAAYIDRILRGARPADLPVEEPTRFELTVNLKTAKTLGLTIPSSILGRADQVIQ